jgi:hypothetical protein
MQYAKTGIQKNSHCSQPNVSFSWIVFNLPDDLIGGKSQVVIRGS